MSYDDQGDFYSAFYSNFTSWREYRPGARSLVPGAPDPLFWRAVAPLNRAIGTLEKDQDDKYRNFV